MLSSVQNVNVPKLIHQCLETGLIEYSPSLSDHLDMSVKPPTSCHQATRYWDATDSKCHPRQSCPVEVYLDRSRLCWHPHSSVVYLTTSELHKLYAKQHTEPHTLCLARGLEARDVGGLPVGISGPKRGECGGGKWISSFPLTKVPSSKTSNPDCSAGNRSADESRRSRCTGQRSGVKLNDYMRLGGSSNDLDSVYKATYTLKGLFSC